MAQDLTLAGLCYPCSHHHRHAHDPGQAAGPLAGLFATYHRHSYTGCKPASGDIIMGAAALAADYSGIEKQSHVRDKLAELAATAELIYGAGIAASVNGKPASSGTCVPNAVFCNVGRYHAGVSVMKEYEILAEVAGGLPATLPFEADFYNPDTAGYLSKYMMRRTGVSAEDQHRCFRLLGTCWPPHTAA